MSFATWTFATFFLLVFAAYWALPTRRGRHVLLLLVSYLFYMSWNTWLISLILASTLLDYSIGLGLDRASRTSRRKLLLIASITGNLGILAVFKYAGFFVDSLVELLTAAGIRANLDTLSIILPVGISFYTFQTMSYTIDVYRRKIAAERSLLDFGLYVAFFPQLVAGPIVKAREFLPQLKAIKRFEWTRLESGVVLFMLGLTKKILIADNLATLVDPVFADPTGYVTRDLWLAMFAYGGQIYCDFSGYSDMAIALACMLGFDLPRNFASPYLAVGLGDFWRRWHISLSTWLRDYLYIPLGGSRFGRLLTYRNLMITMLLGGLWHGASWTFVIWGAIHGVALVACKLFGTSDASTAGASPNDASSADARTPDPRLAGARRAEARMAGGRMSGASRDATRTSAAARVVRTAATWALTLLVVHVAWVFFRCQPQGLSDGVYESTAAALDRAVYFVTHLVVPARPESPVWIESKIPASLLLIFMALIQIHAEWRRRGRPAIVLPAPVAGVAYALWIVALVTLSAGNDSPFIYFQF